MVLSGAPVPEKLKSLGLNVAHLAKPIVCAPAHINQKISDDSMVKFMGKNQQFIPFFLEK